MITQGDFVSLALRGTTPEPHSGRGIKIKFVTSIGENDGTDVPSFDHQISRAREFMQLLPDNFADNGNPANARNLFVHTIITQTGGRIDVIDQHARFTVSNAAHDRCRFERLRDTIDVFCSDSLFENMPGDRSIDGAGINVHKPHPTG